MARAAGCPRRGPRSRSSTGTSECVIRDSTLELSEVAAPRSCDRGERHMIGREDEWLWGWDPTPGIVSVWAEPDGRAFVWRRLPRTRDPVRDDVRFRPWLLLASLDDLAHLGKRLRPEREGPAPRRMAIAGTVMSAGPARPKPCLAPRPAWHRSSRWFHNSSRPQFSKGAQASCPGPRTSCLPAV